jgi:predicted ferric reductase
MATRRFWLLLSGTICVALGGLWLLDAYLPATQGISPFTLICIGVFIAINVVAFLLGKRAALSSSPFRFVHLIMALIILKMMICILLVVVYMRIGEPVTKLFVVPFLWIYIVFTIFEIIVLEKLARMKPQSHARPASHEPVTHE